ncbi:MAG: sulfotransferase [Chromatocurvus sp.]
MPTEGRRPNLFLVGAQKSGTTTLATMLASHPEIFMCSPKEPGFLAFGESGYTALDGYGRRAQADGWVVRSEQAYIDLFRRASPAARFLGEASTWYLSEPDCAERLRAFNPEAHIILILRQPADRAYSAWCDARRNNEEPCATFAEALAREKHRESPSHLLRYREMGRYARYLRRYIEVFGKQQILVLFYEDLRDHPEDLWRECCDFLGLAVETTPRAHRQNRAGLPRSRLLHHLMRSEMLKSSLRAALPMPLLAGIKSRLEGINMQGFPPLPPTLREQITIEDIDEIRELEVITGRDLKHWLSAAEQTDD